MNEESKYLFQHESIFDSKFDIDVQMQGKGNFFDTHYHDYIEIVCQLTGCSEHYINNQKVILHEKEIIVINTNQSHKNISSDEDIMNIILPISYLDRLILESSYENTVINLKEFMVNYNHTHAYTLSEASSSVIMNIYNMHINKTDVEMYHFRLKLELIQFFISLESIYNNFTVEPVEEIDVIKYINDNLQTACLNDFSKTLNYSAPTVSQQIKSKYKMTFMDILQFARLNKAAELLLATDYKISYIMREVGYNNKTFFYSLFKERYHLTPHQFRKQYKNTVTEISSD